jgi:hypothetical protein
VGREYRRRLLLALGAEGIQIPSRIVQVGEAGKPFPVLLMQGEAPGAVPR